MVIYDEHEPFLCGPSCTDPGWIGSGINFSGIQPQFGVVSFFFTKYELSYSLAVFHRFTFLCWYDMPSWIYNGMVGKWYSAVIIFKLIAKIYWCEYFEIENAFFSKRFLLIITCIGIDPSEGVWMEDQGRAVLTRLGFF